jgi:protein SCO1/2
MISQKKRFIIYIIVGVLIGITWWVTKPTPLPILGNIPPFEMTNSKGLPFGTDDLTGKIWVADFIFTTCAGPCPVMSTAMADIHKSFLDDEIHTVSYTVNPDYDTPEILAVYAERFNADRSLWHFLTAPYEDIQFIIQNGFKMGDIEEIVFHSTRFALIDKEMNIRGYYTGTDSDDVKMLKRDISKLSQESL